jgi:prepilin-type N-terminal cleavage/methylation domain-containing protein
MKIKRNVKGFTLIEMVIVISIIGVLAAIIIPSVMYYLRKAKRTAAIADARTILTATQSAVIEQIAVSGTFSLDKTGCVVDGKRMTVGGLTNTSMHNAITKRDYDSYSTKTNASDTAIADSIIEMINTEIDAGTASSGSAIFNKNCQAYMDSVGANYCFIVLYTNDGEVPFMQIYNKGILVTYAAGSFIADDSDNAKFIKLGGSFYEPFISAGKKISEIPARVKNSKFPSKW